MTHLLDQLWFKILEGVHALKGVLDSLLNPLNLLGPAVPIFVVALATVVLTKLLSRYVKTKRYIRLEKEFIYWKTMREEAARVDDPEVARALEKGIDQAELNKVYFDYMVEGFLLNLVTRMLPIVTALAYVNEAYRPENLIAQFGRASVFESLSLGAPSWFIICLVMIYTGWGITKGLLPLAATSLKSNLSQRDGN